MSTSEVFVKRFGHSMTDFENAGDLVNEMEYSIDINNSYYVYEWGPEYPGDESSDFEPVRAYAVVNEAGIAVLEAEAEANGWDFPREAS